jgi:hypothetical protein
MTTRQDSGDEGQKIVCELIRCPNCDAKLIQLPKNFPIYDVQCSGCLFRAQVKSSYNFNGKKITGSGWNVMNHAMKSGMVIPPVILNTKTEIRFYPYIPKVCVVKRKKPATFKSGRNPHWMFDYEVSELKYYVLLNKKSNE